MLRDPHVYLFDEPLSNLDAALCASTRTEIARLKQEMPERTMIYVTHDQAEAMTLADRVADRIVVLSGAGEGGDAGDSIAQIGTPRALYDHPETEFVARFIGTPGMTFLPGTSTGTGPVTEVTLAGGEVLCSARPTAAADLMRDVNIGLRPEHLTLTEGQSCPEGLTGKVALVARLGDVSLLYLTRGDGGQVIAKLPGGQAARLGSEVGVTVAPENVHLFRQGRALAVDPGGLC